jgi:dephospho-CoA kinase
VPLVKIGITGNIACGKSTVDTIVHELTGATIIDADRVTHDLLRNDHDVKEKIVAAFGSGILDAAGHIDRAALGRIVFGSAPALLQLEGIVHPAVRTTIRAMLDALPANGAVVVDAVKLLAGDLGAWMDVVWWVTAGTGQQTERLVRLRGLREADARARIAVQPSLDLYRSHVHVIIDNSGNLAETRNQVIAALKPLRIGPRSPGLPDSASASSEEWNINR